MQLPSRSGQATPPTFAQISPGGCFLAGYKSRSRGLQRLSKAQGATPPASAMKVLLHLTLLGAVLLAAAAQAPAEKETLVTKVRGYVQQMAQTANDALTRVKDSETAQHAREWVSNWYEDVQTLLDTLKAKFSEIWEQQPPAQ